MASMGEREVRQDGLFIHFRHEGDLAEIPFTLAVLVLQDVALALFTAQHFPRRSDFESLGDGFSRFGYTSIFGHRGGECGAFRWIGKGFPGDFHPRITGPKGGPSADFGVRQRGFDALVQRHGVFFTSQAGGRHQLF